jgi:hypothetical protein
MFRHGEPLAGDVDARGEKTPRAMPGLFPVRSLEMLGDEESARRMGKKGAALVSEKLSGRKSSQN